MLTMLVLAMGLIVGFAPDTPIGRPLKRLLVDLPAARLNRIRPGVLILMLLLTVASAALIVAAKNDGAVLVAQGLPEAVASIFALDVATYLDVLAVAWLLAASVRLRAVKAVVRSAIARLRVTRPATPRARAPRSRPAAPPPANSDDEGRPGFALAA